VAIFCGNLTAQRVSTINGGGEQTRDYVYVGDVARANVLALEGDPPSGAHNVGTAVETNMNELYRLLQDLSGKTYRAKICRPGTGRPSPVSNCAVPSTRHARAVSLAGAQRCTWPLASKRRYGFSKRTEGCLKRNGRVAASSILANSRVVFAGARSDRLPTSLETKGLPTLLKWKRARRSRSRDIRPVLQPHPKMCHVADAVIVSATCHRFGESSCGAGQEEEGTGPCRTSIGLRPH
jgi:hypothetical protein